MSTISENGTEFRRRAILKWAGGTGVVWQYADPGKPQRYGSLASVNGCPRDERWPKEIIGNLISACVSELEAEGVDLSLYNTVMNARDVRAVVEGLGYDVYNIYGISYGTRLALEVMRTIPEGLRSVVLDSVVPMNVRLYDELLGPHQDAIDALVQQCAADPDCAEAYPDFGSQISQVAADLRDNPIPRGRGPLTVTEDLFLPLFQGCNLAANSCNSRNARAT